MSDQDIAPRIDEDGVGWCDGECSYFAKGDEGDWRTESHDHLGDEVACLKTKEDEVCPVHARRMARWAARAHDQLAGCAAMTWAYCGTFETARSWEHATDDLLRDYPGTDRQDGGE